MGDTGVAPTDEELTRFANEVREHTIKPALDLAEAWTKRANEVEEKAAWMSFRGQADLAHGLMYRARAYRTLASDLITTLKGNE